MLSQDAAMRPELLSLIGKLTGHRIAVVGDYMLDEYVFGDADRISPEAPVPVVTVEQEIMLPGGAGNVARNLCALGVKPICCGFIGDDEAGHRLREDLATSGADVVGLLTVPGMRTTRKTRVLARAHQLVRVDRNNVTAAPEAQQERLVAAVSDALQTCPGLLFSDYAKHTLTARITSQLIPAARQRGLVVVADPKPQNMSLFGGSTLVCPNALEAQQATGIACDDAEGLRAAAGTLLAELCLEAALITRGPYGMYLLTADGVESQLETAATQVSDVTGAGDTVVAVLTGALVAGGSYLQAALLANVAAGHVVQHLGCAVVEAEELTELITAACG